MTSSTTPYTVTLGIGTLLLAIGCEVTQAEAPSAHERGADTVDWPALAPEPEAVDA